MLARRTFTRRRYKGQQLAEPLLEWLNHPEWEHPGKRKVFRVLEQLQGLIATASWEDITKELVDLPKPFLMVRPIVQRREWKAAWEGLKKELRKCKFHPDLRSIDEGERLNFYWREVSRNSLHGLIHKILLLADLGMLLRVKKCRQCQTWFYAKFSHSKFCNPVCRKKHSDSVQRGKKHRREYMEEYMRAYRRKKKRRKKR